MFNTLTGRQIRKTTNRFVIGTAVMAVTCSGIALTPTTADAVIRTHLCRADGFTGRIIIDYETNSSTGKISFVNRINYQIDKGSNDGGNRANVDYIASRPGSDLKYSTGDAAIQDNQQHYLGGPYYVQGNEEINAYFIFDKSRASDPRCSIAIQ
ncbi:MAG: hypothetical protein RMZ42_19820 [Nostoc sp. DedQUE05]|uniref:hypothetical protein n=1 Tax=Nostoc sp. DedQUE05 TaxID=3075391 RepID=UPI002AD51461|nr:hypothetical protein [Nostoc sp. DedQUE05]MDZ8094152.1 hypothetical protein [Nostoc sp. DedQUE05]